MIPISRTSKIVESILKESGSITTICFPRKPTTQENKKLFKSLIQDGIKGTKCDRLTLPEQNFDDKKWCSMIDIGNMKVKDVEKIVSSIIPETKVAPAEKWSY